MLQAMHQPSISISLPQKNSSQWCIFKQRIAFDLEQ